MKFKEYFKALSLINHDAVKRPSSEQRDTIESQQQSRSESHYSSSTAVSILESAPDPPEFVVVPDDIELYKKTHFFRYFERTDRYPGLEEAVKDLSSVFADKGDTEMAQNILNLFESCGLEDHAKCITTIWTSQREITNLINSALVIDAVKAYSLKQSMFQYHFDQFKNSKVSYKTVLKRSIRFIRILNSCIVDMGTFYNIEDRVTYRGIHNDVMQNVKVGQTFRVVNWM